LVAQDRIVGLLNCYAGRDRAPLDEDDLQLTLVLATTAAMGYANASAWRRLEELNQGLEVQVEERTRQLRSTLDDVQRLASDLEEKNALVENAYRELSELDRIKNELISRISSELKTPVTSLTTAAKILDSARDAPPEKTGRFVAVIRDEAERIAELIDSIFQASVLAAAQQVPERRPVPAENLFKGAISPLRDLAKGRDVRLHVLIPHGLEAVSCDPATMETAVRAVVKNAIEFSERGGQVKLEVRRVLKGSQPWLFIRVSDTGVGIGSEDLPHVFDTFWQGANVVSDKPRGVGLGLAIVKRIVENHGGTITLTSKQAEGTEVTIALPQEAGAAEVVT
jgi:signal transduction histidine kinase